MGYPRHAQISVKETPYYHCIGRCVRRAWLWGYDEYSGKDYSHRKQWVIDRLKELELLFAINICAYAVMSNHYHLVLFVDANRVQAWSEREVVRRWTQLFKLPDLVRRYLEEGVTAAEQAVAKKIIAKWRKRLIDVSWFMRCLNEHLARRANKEDGCTGRFWEGRFKCQALLDEAGLLTAMAYVDLNPIRAGIAKTPEESDFTSIYERIRVMKGKQPRGPRLHPFHRSGRQRNALPFSLHDYLQLVDWTGRQARADKRGSIDSNIPPILERLNIDKEAWTEAIRPHGNVFGRALGKLDHLRIHAKALGQAWIKGIREAKRMYRSA